MNNLVLQGTEFTAIVNFDAVSGVLELAGFSYPENAMEFYRPLGKWIEQYFQKGERPVKLHFRLKYINTSSSKCILDLLHILERCRKQGKQAQVYWHYHVDDDDMFETGNEFAEGIELPFRMVPEKSEDGSPNDKAPMGKNVPDKTGSMPRLPKNGPTRGTTD